MAMDGKNHPGPLTRPKREAARSQEPAPDLPPPLARFLHRHPLCRRHPHPMAARFAIVFMLAAPFFAVIYLITGVPSFETTAFHCLGAGVVSIPIANLTGLLTRHVNYPGKPTPTLVLENRLAWLLFALTMTAFLWRLFDPEILQALTPAAVIYLLLVLSLAPLVTIISFFGGILVFPLEK